MDGVSPFQGCFLMGPRNPGRRLGSRRSALPWAILSLPLRGGMQSAAVPFLCGYVPLMGATTDTYLIAATSGRNIIGAYYGPMQVSSP